MMRTFSGSPRILAWGGVVLWIGLIFPWFFIQSDWLRRLGRFVYISDRFQGWVLETLFHFVFFAGLTLLVLHAAQVSVQLSRRHLGFVFGALFATAFGQELLQLSIATRGFSADDVVVNLVAIGFGGLVWFLSQRSLHVRKC